MSGDTVKVLWTLTPGCVFRAPPVTAAMDGSHHEVPQDLDLRYGLNEGIARSTLDYWKRHTAGLDFYHTRDDTFVILANDGRDPRAQLDAERRSLDADRRAALDRERRALDAERRAFDRARSRSRRR
jgi:hypothetical protein